MVFYVKFDLNGFLCGTYSCHVKFVTYHAIPSSSNQMECHAPCMSTTNHPPIRFFYVWLFGRPSFNVLFFNFLCLILRLNSDASSKFKFVVTPRSSSVIHFVCVSLEIKIGHGNLNLSELLPHMHSHKCLGHDN
jgi:hypothetical protein